ncbi:hypothetical protein [Thiolapillus sp.]|uniref:hypothetical protein n=1 Tax=Thiolapillus sp. TaxID=2017437 RepID=UPI003AF6B44C
MVPEFFHVAIVGLMILVPMFFIYKKAGFHPAWSLLVFLPGLGLLLIFLQLAFLPWPNLQDQQGQES